MKKPPCPFSDKKERRIFKNFRFLKTSVPGTCLKCFVFCPGPGSVPIRYTGQKIPAPGERNPFTILYRQKLSFSLTVPWELFSNSFNPDYSRGLEPKFLPRGAYDTLNSVCPKDAKILEVGCGNGRLLNQMAGNGYTNLTGCDRFTLPFDRYTSEDGRITFIRGTMEDCEGTFDHIIMHHSFEHLDNPHETMEMIASKLNPGGAAVISLPVAGSNAFEKYGKYWYDLDAPRHIYIYSESALISLAEKYGLSCQKVVYDSNALQYIGSIQYQKGMNGAGRRSLYGMIQYGMLSLTKYAQMAKQDNEDKKGDQATFVFRKSA